MSTGGKEPEMGKVLIKLAERVRNDKIKAGTFEQALTAIYEIGLEKIGKDEPLKEPKNHQIKVQNLYRNDRNMLRDSQRKAWAKACGVADK